jgi:hypothetical protein
MLLKVVSENVDLCDVIKSMAKTLSKHGLVPLSCLTEGFTHTLCKYNNSCICIMNFTLMKEFRYKLVLKGVLVG